MNNQKEILGSEEMNRQQVSVVAGTQMLRPVRAAVSGAIDVQEDGFNIEPTPTPPLVGEVRISLNLDNASPELRSFLQTLEGKTGSERSKLLLTLKVNPRLAAEYREYLIAAQEVGKQETTRIAKMAIGAHTANVQQMIKAVAINLKK